MGVICQFAPIQNHLPGRRYVDDSQLAVDGHRGWRIGVRVAIPVDDKRMLQVREQILPGDRCKKAGHFAHLPGHRGMHGYPPEAGGNPDILVSIRLSSAAKDDTGIGKAAQQSTADSGVVFIMRFTEDDRPDWCQLVSLGHLANHLTV